MVKKQRVQKESDERYTPDYVLDIIRGIGSIALDPATTVDNRTGAEVFYTFEDDGLTKDWFEVTNGKLVYVNPPFSNLKGWVNKFAEEGNKGCNIVALLPGDTSTKWFQENVWDTASAICLWKGRIEFIRVSKAFGCGAMQPTLFAFWGPEVEKFENAFKLHGKVLKRINRDFSM